MRLVIRSAIVLAGVAAAIVVGATPGAIRPAIASAQSPGVEVLSASMYVREDRNTVVVGEVANNTAGTADRVEVKAFLRDEQGTPIRDITGFIDLSEIPAGGTSPFSIRTYSPLPRVAASFELSVRYDAGEPSRVFTFDVSVDSIELNGRGRLEASGGVINTSGIEVSSLNVRVAIYDEQGTLLRVMGTAARPSLLNAGARASWSTSFTDPPPPSYSTYKVWAEGRPIGR